MKTYAKKIANTHLYDDSGKHICVTVLELIETVVVGKRILDKDGYESVIYGMVSNKPSIKKSFINQFKDVENLKKVCEQRIKKEAEESKVGTEITINDFSEGDILTVKSKTKGKGFAGTVKRHGFHTGPKTHGSNNYRQPGSIGDTGPQRVVLGKKMAGHMGDENVTLKNIKVVRVDKENSTLWIKGSLPGARKSLLTIEK